MKINNAKFITSAPSIKECPDLKLPEFALIGRSNVGKSSFINNLVNRKGLAKTSNKPGKTRLINLFDINEKFIIADLPGYGFAQVSKKMQDDWQRNIEEYLLQRKELVALVQFIDARHPVQKNDHQMSEWIKYNELPYIVVATKIDCIGRSQIQKTIASIKKELQTEVYPFSKASNYYNSAILNVFEEKINSFN
ncbi:MAG: ribosome biogenesis GTP-binding protein YihA/YsxC [Candidatus Gastranaerophilales bacterium]|nr:ribosome biogenesis GTP-binding protein YihA/YsxC [Candidatus Gastranaerophilales bacterium]